MSLQSVAQDQQLLVVDPSALSPLEVSMPVDSDYGIHPDQPLKMSDSTPSLEVHEPVDVEIVVEELPGAPAGTKDPEPMLEVSDEPVHADEKPADDANDAKKMKNEKWDWASKGPHGFVAWVKERIDSVPKHSGFDTAGLERALAYMEKLDNEISKAMRMDLDEELDANKVEDIRSKLDDGISRLQDRLEKVRNSKKSSKKRKKSAEVVEQSEGLVKEAQKILGVKGVYIMAPLLISGIARICINGTVSAGRDISDLYHRQVKQWKLSDREQFELRQLLFDMGFPMPYDRSVSMTEDFDPGSDSNYELMQNFKG
jgi:hypothetical protein